MNAQTTIYYNIFVYGRHVSHICMRRCVDRYDAWRVRISCAETTCIECGSQSGVSIVWKRSRWATNESVGMSVCVLSVKVRNNTHMLKQQLMCWTLFTANCTRANLMPRMRRNDGDDSSEFWIQPEAYFRIKHSLNFDNASILWIFTFHDLFFHLLLYILQSTPVTLL